MIGTYSINGSVFELYLILFFGVLGYLFDKVDIPIAPLVLSLVLAGIMEQSFRQAMTISNGNPATFIGSGITITLVAMSIISVAIPILWPKFKKRQRSKHHGAIVPAREDRIGQ